MLCEHGQLELAVASQEKSKQRPDGVRDLPRITIPEAAVARMGELVGLQLADEDLPDICRRLNALAERARPLLVWMENQPSLPELFDPRW
jgi:hypothetical protein